MQDYREQRRQRMMAAFAARFARVRGEMTDAEFARLLADMVSVAERFVEIDAKPGARLPDAPAELMGLANIPRK